VRRKGSRQLRGILKADEVKLLQSALFHLDLKNCACDESAKEEMRLYLHSWVQKPLAQILKAIETRHAKKLERETK
jgi:hypothetical protein